MPLSPTKEWLQKRCQWLSEQCDKFRTLNAQQADRIAQQESIIAAIEIDRMTDQPASDAALRALVEQRIAELEREHGSAASVGEHEALTYSYDMEVAAALHELKRLTAASVPASPPTREGWQPIETAPKDAYLLGWWPYWSSTPVIVKFATARGRWESEVALQDDTADKPTHWMPLPPAPAVSPAPQEGE